MSGSVRQLIRNVRKQAERDVAALRMRKALEMIADGRHGETVEHLRRIARAALPKDPEA